MSEQTRGRLTWLASGLLVLVWAASAALSFLDGDAWVSMPDQGVSLMRLNRPVILAGLLVLLGGLLAWRFYDLGMSELRKQADMEKRYRLVIEEAYRGTLQALTSALDLRDDETYGHSRRVMGYSVGIGQRLGLSQHEMQTLAWGALLHDLGKIGIRDGILLKPGPLTPEERVAMNEHAAIGWQLVQTVPFLARTGALIRHHHERYDGNGYPDRLAGENIPLLARIFTVADAFDAMTSPRPYRPEPRTFAEAANVIRELIGTQFCPTVAEAFLSIPEAELARIRQDSFETVNPEDLPVPAPQLRP